MQTIETIVFLFLSLIFIALREGMVLADQKFGDNKYSDTWHVFGLFIRGSIIASIVLLTKPEFCFYFIIAVIIAWPAYNIIINLFRQDKWYYVGTKGIDGIIRKIFKHINFDK